MSAQEIDHPPTGTPEYEEWAAEDKGPAILAVCWAFTAMATVFVVARVFTRIKLYSKLRSDDYWVIAGLVCGYISTAFTTAGVAHGNGQHFPTLTQSQQEKVIEYTMAGFCPGVMSFGFPKVAVVILLTRLLNPGKYHRWFLWWLAIWSLLTLGATVGTLLGQCQPAASQWNFDMPGTCVDKKIIIDFSLYAGAYSAFVDVYLAVYPAVVLFKLQLKLRKKIALTVALGIGCVGGAIAIYKTTRIPSGLGSPDMSYDSPDLGMWTIIEGSTLIMACTIPVLSPLMELIFKRRNPFRSSTRGERKYYEENSQRRRTLEARSGGGHPQIPTPNPIDVDVEHQTMIGSDDSQEAIVGEKVRPEDSDSSSMRNFSRPVGVPMDRGILRTDEVKVSYDSDRTLNR